MFKKKVVPLILLLCISLTGCQGFFPEGIEIENYDTVQLVGIDQNEDEPEYINMTSISSVVSSSASNEGGGGSNNVRILTSAGKTLFEASRTQRTKTDKIAFTGYWDYILISEKAAQEDFTKYLDFATRDHETRLSPGLFIIRGSSAKDFISQTSSGEMFIVNRLDNLVRSEKTMGNVIELKLIDCIAQLDNKYEATIIPVLKLMDTRDLKLSGEMPEKSFTSDGYAIIKDFKLVGYIDAMSAVGYNFLINKIESIPISVKDYTGKYAGLEVIKASTSFEPVFSGDKLESIKIKTHVFSNLPEQQSRAKITDKKGIDDLGSKQSDYIKAKMQEVISTSQKYQVDCFNLAEKIRMKHPMKWDKIKGNWNEIYPGLKFDYEVTSHIRRSYDIVLPNGYQGEK